MIIETLLALCLSTKLCEPALVDTLEAYEAQTTAAMLPIHYHGVGSDSVERWRPLIGNLWPVGEIDTALCVMQHESGGDPHAGPSETNDHGLMQIHAPLWTDLYGVSIEDLYDAETNAEIAFDIWTRWGWEAWTAYNRGKCNNL